MIDPGAPFDNEGRDSFVDGVYANIRINQQRRRRKIFAFIIIASVLAVIAGFCIGWNFSV